MSEQVGTTVPEKPSIRQAVRLVDRVQAARWLEECSYPRNRVPSEPFVDSLVTALKRGEWNIRELQFGVLPDGAEQLLDGQHGLRAIKKSGISAWCRIAWQDFPDQDAIDRAYARIDAGRPRNMRDALTAMHIGFGVLPRPSDVARLSAAITLMQTRMLGFGSMTAAQRTSLNLRNRDSKARLCQEWLKEMEIFCTLTKEPLIGLSSVFGLAGVVAVALITIRYQPEKATEFWNILAQTPTLPHGSPLLQLRNLCESRKSRNGGPYVVRYTANAWNAWYQGKETLSGSLGVQDKKSNMRIYGTPYSGGSIPGIDDLPKTLEEWRKIQKRYGAKGKVDGDEAAGQHSEEDLDQIVEALVESELSGIGTGV